MVLQVIFCIVSAALIFVGSPLPIFPRWPPPEGSSPPKVTAATPHITEQEMNLILFQLVIRRPSLEMP